MHYSPRSEAEWGCSRKRMRYRRGCFHSPEGCYQSLKGCFQSPEGCYQSLEGRFRFLEDSFHFLHIRQFSAIISVVVEARFR